jgi:hypothetical protein
VGLSLRGDLMRYSDPAWVETLRLGVNLILWSVVVAIFAAVITAVTARSGPSVEGALVNLVATALQIIGSWMLTTPDPSGLGEDHYGTSRKIIRFALLIGILQQFLTIVTQTTALPSEMQLLVTILAAIFGLIALVGTFATLKYLSSLAMRIPSESLAQRATTVMWGFSVSLGVVLILGVIAALAAKAGATGGAMGIMCFAAICGLAFLVFGIMYLFMLGRFAKELRIQADYARSTWASTPVNSARAPLQ